MFSKLLMIMLGLTGAWVSAQECSADYQCGNIPYMTCKQGADLCTSTIPGLALSSDYIYYGASCWNPDGYTLNSTIKRIPISGGVPSTIFSISNTRFSGISDILSLQGNYIYYEYEATPDTGLQAININTKQIVSPYLPIVGSQRFGTGPEFSDSDVEYTCQGDWISSNGATIDQWSGLVSETSGLTGSSSASTLKTVYNIGNNACGVIRASGNDLYFTSGRNFYKGTKDCSNCTLPSPFFTASDAVQDFALSSQYIFFATVHGLFRMDLSGQNYITLVSGFVSGVRVSNDGGKVYFNDEVSIRSINADGTSNTVLSQAPWGYCECVSRFTGYDCSACNGGQVQWSASGPSCVSLDGNGRPYTCSADYQCGNVPYTVCSSGKCECVSNFSGAKCDQCAGTISWNNGVPSCAN